jgi:Family of unknown function (DUF5675)
MPTNKKQDLNCHLLRSMRTNKTTIGDFWIDGVSQCYMLEDVDRGLHSSMPLEQLLSMKVKTKTAVTTGRYQIVLYYSPKLKMYVPLLMHVPAFSFVEIHPGNNAENTDACLLPGLTKDKDWVGSSRPAFKKCMDIFLEHEKTHSIFITIA